MELKQIGTAFNGLRNTPRDWNEVESRLAFENDYLDGLYGLEHHRRIWVIFGFHIQKGWSPRVRPRKAKDDSLVGIFASRGIQRPNKLGMTLVELIRVEDSELIVRGLDAFDGSPVFDIKPFDEDYDSFRE